MKNDLVHIYRELDKVGYLKLSLFSSKEINEIIQTISIITNELKLSHNKYHVTIFSDDLLYKEKVRDILTRFVSKKLVELFPDYQIITTNLIIKSPQSGEVPLHQNWTFVNEEEHRSYTIWIPLIDTNELNGTLEFITGSHNIFCDVKRGHNTPYFFIKENERLKKYLTPIYATAGEVLILDDAILHYSKQNNTNENRIAIQATIVPKHADLFHYHYKKTFFKDKIYKLIVTPAFYKNLDIKIENSTTVSSYKKRIISDIEWLRIKEIFNN